MLAKIATVEDLNLPTVFIESLILKYLHFNRSASYFEITQALKLPQSVIEPLVRNNLQKKELVGITGIDSAGAGNFHISLTPKGSEQAKLESNRSSYAASCPVSLNDYHRVVMNQRGRSAVSMTILKKAFSDLVIDDALLEKIGPAIINEGAVFFYGPPGTGKTSIAERMIKIYSDGVWIPYSIYSEGEVISLFDPSIHIPITGSSDSDISENGQSKLDPRWIWCERPAVVVGGELSRSNLDLQRDADSGVYKPPITLTSNNGILVVDDFGRQIVTPAELLNRWIVPLSRDVDYLSLVNGVKFKVPFDSKVVFSTNLPPSSLGDEAFFRRIPNKVHIGSIEELAFRKIFSIVLESKGLKITKDAIEFIIEEVRERSAGGDLRPYLPADFVKIFLAINEFKENELALNDNHPESLKVIKVDHIKAIIEIYFAQDVGAGWATSAQDV